MGSAVLNTQSKWWLCCLVSLFQLLDSLYLEFQHQAVPLQTTMTTLEVIMIQLGTTLALEMTMILLETSLALEITMILLGTTLALEITMMLLETFQEITMMLPEPEIMMGMLFLVELPILPCAKVFDI